MRDVLFQSTDGITEGKEGGIDNALVPSWWLQDGSSTAAPIQTHAVFSQLVRRTITSCVPSRQCSGQRNIHELGNTGAAPFLFPSITERQWDDMRVVHLEASSLLLFSSSPESCPSRNGFEAAILECGHRIQLKKESHAGE